MTSETISPQTSDAGLVEIAVSGKPEAFDELVKRYQRAVHAVAFAVVADREAALDVLQESFIAAYRQLHTLDDGSRFGPWVCGIARNQAKRLRRVRYRRASREFPLPETETAPTRPQADALAERIGDALAALTEMQADVITLFYMEGYSIVECAAMLEVPQGTIKRRLHDARQRLKKEMADMVKEHLKEFALPEDYRVVIEKPSKIHTTRPQLVHFKERWILLWQDGVYWEPWDGPFWFWLSESSDGKSWSEPRRLDLPEGNDAMRRNPDYLSLISACVQGGKLFFLTHNFSGQMDLYSSEDTLKWTIHPRFMTGMVSRGSLFSSPDNLYLIYPSIFDGFGRVDMIRSSDGGFSWTWMNSPYVGDGSTYDAAGVVVGGDMYVGWREILGKWESTGEMDGVVPICKHLNALEDPDVSYGALSQRVWIGHSADGGQTWGHRVRKPEYYPDGSGIPPSGLQPGKPEPLLIEALDLLKPYFSNSLRFAAFGDTVALVQEVRRGDCTESIWVAISSDGGRTWPRKAVCSAGILNDPAIAFAPDGTLIIAASSHTGDESKPWIIHSRIEY